MHKKRCSYGENMNIAICEDHKEEALWLKKQIEYWSLQKGHKTNTTLFENAAQFWFHYEPDQSFDVLLLDVEMPGENGILLARKLRERHDDIPVIFVTGADEYISEGYDVQAVHYLLKPVNKDKLAECLNRVYEKMKDREPFVLLNTSSGTIKLLQKDILKIESFSGYCIYTALQGEYRVNISLKDALNALQKENFSYSHRGIVVNLQHVEAITHEQVILTGKNTALVSRRQYSSLNKAFIDFYNGGRPW